MGNRLRSVGHRKSAECRKTRVGGQVAKIGVGGSIKQVRNLVLNKVYGIGVNAVIDHGGAATDDGFLIAQNTAEQTVFDSWVEGEGHTRREIVTIRIIDSAGVVGFAAQVVADEGDGRVTVDPLSGSGQSIV